MTNKKNEIIRGWLKSAWNDGNPILGKDIHIDEITPCKRENLLSESFKTFHQIEDEKKLLNINSVLLLVVDLECQIIPYKDLELNKNNINKELHRATPPSFHLWDDQSMKWLSSRGRVVRGDFYTNNFNCIYWEYNDEDDPRELNRSLFFYLKGVYDR